MIIYFLNKYKYITFRVMQLDNYKIDMHMHSHA
jgi:hypothetical protein